MRPRREAPCFRLRLGALSMLAVLPACRGCFARAAAPRAGAVLAALGPALHGDTPIERLLVQLPEAWRDSTREALTDYVYCTAAEQPARCARLAGEDVERCAEAAAQVDARAAGGTPWFGVAEGLRFCGEHAPATGCARFADAVERGDSARCEGLGEGLGDCAALASGDPARCAGRGREAASCRRAVRDVAALRRSVEALAATPSGAWRAAAIGRLRGAAACDAELRLQLDAPATPDE